MSEAPLYTYEDRELSWLSFNARVLQEAQDPTVPLYERLFFLGVFSSNLDEFYRVRVASHRSLLRLGKKSAGKLDYDPRRLLAQIQHRVVSLQEECGRTFTGVLEDQRQVFSNDVVEEQDRSRRTVRRGRGYESG